MKFRSADAGCALLLALSSTSSANASPVPTAADDISLSASSLWLKRSSDTIHPTTASATNPAHKYEDLIFIGILTHPPMMFPAQS
jgi:hypothetical protein